MLLNKPVEINKGYFIGIHYILIKFIIKIPYGTCVLGY